jgi:ubiquinone/menaquinone biosynthesis C-methylase UbiE
LRGPGKEKLLSEVDITLVGLQPDRLPQTVAARTRRIYDRLAAVYPLSTMLFHARAHRAALQDAGIRDGMSVLEVATGSGEMFHRLVGANRNGTTLGLDLSPKMAARTQRRARRAFPRSRAQCHAVDARQMPYRSDSFDVLVCCYLLELLAADDIALTLGEFHRVLRPRGTLALILIGQNVKLFNRLYRLAGSLAPAFWGRQVESTVPDLVRARGFSVTSDRHVRQTGYPSRVLVAKK